MPHHTSVYQERKRKPAKTLDEALRRLGKSVRQRIIDTRYPAKGNEYTRRVGLRILGEKDD
jgi:hypothetical protein